MWSRPLCFFELSLLIALAAAPSGAQSVRGLEDQSPAQAQKDASECRAIAIQTSGYPAAAPPISSPVAPQAGERVPSSAAGAAARAADAEVRARQSAYQQAYLGCLTSRGYDVGP
jgi:hypothetical protein